MKRLICVLLSVLLLAGCLASCSVTINHGDRSAETEAQSETEKTAETTTAKVNYAAPTDEEYNELLNLVFSQGNYDSAADNALPRAVFFALHLGGAYPRYAEKGRAFAPNELVESDTPDPRELFYDESEGNYQYWKTSADALDRFLREIMNVEPDHDRDVWFSDDGSSQEDEYDQVETYYEDGFY
ncbi:MAG: membrane lipoprotein lipid attachment site-containing protein, partial [Clostridia bacterium]|nr:membrane lipoprotein lipid attachment site-containing protein [Clostridia bacterium]